MILESIYRDINSYLASQNVAQEKIYHNDVVKSINDSIRELRREYIMNGFVEDFLYTETVLFSDKDYTFPFLYSSYLSYNIIQDVPIALALAQSVVWKTPNELLDEAQTWSTGDWVIKEGTLYEAIEDSDSINTYNLTAKLTNVKNFYTNNGLKFLVGDIVKDQSTNSYYRCDSEYTNNQGETITESGAFTKLYWKELSGAYHEASYLPFTALYESKLSNNIRNYFPFTILNNIVYTSVANASYSFSYVPEWEDVTDLSEELSIPDKMVRDVKLRTTQLLGQKLGLSIKNED